MIRLPLILALALLAPSAAPAQISHAGMYRAKAGPDVASALELAPDGRFRYMHSEGALDEQASGRWSVVDDGLQLDTLPHPRAPEWRIEKIEESKAGPLSVTVKVPGGDNIQGIYLRVGFTNGDRAAGSTALEGWSLAPDDSRQPAWIEFSEPIHGISSPRFELPPQHGMAVSILLVPNEIGIAAFDKTKVSITREGIMLHWRGRDIPYARVGNARSGR